eukprot:2516355-Pyramimonas_sp.AAC.2
MRRLLSKICSRRECPSEYSLQLGAPRTSTLLRWIRTPPLLLLLTSSFPPSPAGRARHGPFKTDR